MVVTTVKLLYTGRSFMGSSVYTSQSLAAGTNDCLQESKSSLDFILQAYK